MVGQNIMNGGVGVAVRSVSSNKNRVACLKERHPEAFEEAKSYEKTALEHGSPFSWCDGETLDELEKPERAKQIIEDYEKRKLRAAKRLQRNPLRPDGEPLDMDDIFGQEKMCLSCHK